jgi:two-component system, LytTR family, response regulator
MKILVIDNDTIIREGLVKLIQLELNDEVFIEQATGVEDGLFKIDSFQPEVVFLDVEMDDGTGFDLMSRVVSPKFQLVFVTAFNKYAVNAFKFSAIDFLLKPIDSLELKETLRKITQSLQQKDLINQLSVLKESINRLQNPDQKIVLKDSKSLYFIRVNEILYCQAESSYTTFHLVDGQKIVVTKTLKEYEQLLEPFNFIRTHHSYLVNSTKILRLDKGDGGCLILEDKTTVPISQRKWEHILQILAK